MRIQLILLISLLFLSCTVLKNKDSINYVQINGDYQIQSVHVDNYQASFTDSTYFVNFSGASIKAYIGCNKIAGSFSQNDSTISISALISTKIYCRNMAEQEISLINALERVDHYKMEGKLLMLIGKQSEIELRRN